MSVQSAAIFSFVVVYLITVVGLATGHRAAGPRELYFNRQLMDHFNYADGRTWNQRYFLDDGDWTGSGPLFFYTGNQGPIEGFMDNSGFIFTLAKEFNALVVFAEHRYYGKSLPLGSESLTPPGIGYLSAEQALADYAVLIQWLKIQYTGITKVIAFGGSYGGMLTAWMRFKYPNLVDGGLASSAPIYFIEGLVSRTAFFAKVTDDFYMADSRCPKYVREGFNELLKWAQYGHEGHVKIKEEMQLCSTPQNIDDINHIVGWARNSFTVLAMLDYPYESDFYAPFTLPPYPVHFSCQLLLDAKSRLRGLAQAAGLYHNGTNGQLTCFDTKREYIECSSPTGCGHGPAAEAWDYQACTEIVLASETNNVTDMFPPTKYDPSAYCKKKWGVSVRPGWMRAQLRSILSSSNVIFSNGNRDPWSVGGVLHSISDSLTAIIIDGAAHHIDLRAPDPRDPPSVTEARERETAIIRRWLTN